MSKNKNNKPATPQETTTVAAGKSWWRESMTRRQATASILRTGAGIGAAGIIMYGIYNAVDDDVDTEFDALELQKKSQWNVGSDDKNLIFPIASLTTTDSMGNKVDTSSTITNELNADYLPSVPNYQPYMVSTLLQSLNQQSLRSAMRLFCTPEMKTAYSRGLGMREIMRSSADAAKTLIIVDLPGPESMAFGAALSDSASLALTFDNWPHPLGVVPAQLTLGALWYYAKEVKLKKQSLPENPPLAMILDSNRLAAYSDADKQFDNRYAAKIPSADQLAKLGITNVLYITPNAGQTVEKDDLNEDFTAYHDKQIEVSMLPATNFQQSANDVKPVDTTRAESSGSVMQSGIQPHYYGGGYSHSYMFFYHYSAFHTISSFPRQAAVSGMSVSRPAYSPVARSTMFSSATKGGKSGIGRTKPSGFGKVSTRTSSRTGQVTGVRSGRSGSYGRSSGRSSS